MPRREPTLSLLFELFVANQEVRTLLADAMAASPLSAEDYAVYSAIDELGPMSATALAAAVGMPPTTLSHYLRSMGEREHLMRTLNSHDARSYLLALSAIGKAAHREANRTFEQAYQAFIGDIADPQAVLAAIGEIQRAAESARHQLAEDATDRAG